MHVHVFAMRTCPTSVSLRVPLGASIPPSTAHICMCMHADFERWVSSLDQWIDSFPAPLRNPSPPPSPPPSVPPQTTRVQHDSASRGWCEPSSSVDGSVAAAAGTGAALSDSSRRDLAGAKAPCAAVARFRRSTETVVCIERVRRSVGKAPDLQTL
eukprot:scaffold35287_cov63-Phaeocystis_antarctica.AAC.4